MIDLKRLLVPTDFSESSEAATKYGVAFARAFGAKLVFLHVEPRHDLEVMVERERAVDGLLNETIETKSAPHNPARELLAKVLAPEEDRELAPDYVLRAAGLGGPAIEILRYAQ